MARFDGVRGSLSWQAMQRRMLAELDDVDSALYDKVASVMPRAELSSTFVTVVSAGTDLSTSRPGGAGAVYWKFDAGVDVGVDGANITHALPGDTYFVASA